MRSTTKIACGFLLGMLALPLAAASSAQAQTPRAGWTGCYLGGQVGGGWGSSDQVSRDGV